MSMHYPEKWKVPPIELMYELIGPKAAKPYRFPYSSSIPKIAAIVAEIVANKVSAYPP